MRLQNEKLAHQSQLGDLHKTIKALQTRQYILFVFIIIALVIGYYLAKWL
jgi:hypothetical protein